MADEELVRLIREEGTAGLEKWREQNPDTIPDLEDADLEGARLSEAHLEGANLRRAHMEGAHLWLAHLEGANLWGAHLEGANLREAHLEGAGLHMCDLQRADLRGADLRGAKLHGVMLDHTQMERDGLGRGVGDELAGDYGEARDAYLRLKQNFENLGEYSAASWAYKKERQMEKFCSAPWNARRFHKDEVKEIRERTLVRRYLGVGWFYVRHTSKWMMDGVVEYLCGYGENVKLVAFWIVVLVFGSALLYWRLEGVLIRGDQPGETVVAKNFRSYLLYALASLVTMEVKFLEAANGTIEAFSKLQAAIGIFLVGLLGFVAGNKIRRS